MSEHEAPGGIAALLDPALDPIFARPTRLGVDSAWYAHLPFAAWLVRTLRPALLVELGTHAGVSYAGFCDQVVAAGLPTRCFAVDSWVGDEHAGFYGDEVLAELHAFHESRYGAFSRLLRMRFDEALLRFEDGSIDLLHIDGRHRFEDVAHDYRSWLPKLSPHGVVLFHDTNVRDRDFGVWRFWTELRQRHPSFEFLHGHGLGVLAPGAAPPPALGPLFDLAADPSATARLRERFALLGERWSAEQQRLEDARRLSATVRRADEAAARVASLEPVAADRQQARADAASMGRSRQALQLEHDRLRDELAQAKSDRHRLSLQAERLRLDADAAVAGAEQHRRDIMAIQAELGASLQAALQELAATRIDAAAALAQTEARAEAERRALLDAHLRRLAEQEAVSASRDLELARVETVLRATLASLSWRLTGPVRALRGRIRGPSAEPHPDLANTTALPAPTPAIPSLAQLAPMPTVPEPDPVPASDPKPVAATPPPHPAPAPALAGWRPIRHVLFVAGEPGTPGATYRTYRAASACAAAGYQVEAIDIFGVAPDNLARADLVVLWRAAWSGHVQTLIGLAHAAGTRVAFDVDDLIVKPSLAVAEIIDGIRTTFVTEAEGRSYFQGMQRTLTSCDLCITTTTELATPIGVMSPIVHVLPNGFDQATERASRYAVRLRGEQAVERRIRLGYAGGTRTHQKDVATIAGPLARLLEQCAEAVLVLFRDPATGQGLVLLEELPELAPYVDRVEWRDMVPLADLPAELARFDISLCPLEQDNPFCEAKSELKYFESALAGVCLVATPTGPFRRAVRHGVTGFLPQDPQDWTNTLLRLAGDPAERARVARAAYHDILWQFGPRRQAELWSQLLAGLDGTATGARAAELSIRRGPYRARELPEIPDSALLFSYDALGEARVTVGMTSFNYERHIGEALDSVLAQTLETIDLVVVDDGSSDGSVTLLLDWARRNRLRFNRLRILRTTRNAGLGGARNVVFDQAETAWIMVLDSDNRLAPEACVRLLAALDEQPLAAFAYPLIRQFGDADSRPSDRPMGADPFDPAHLASGNYIDAMAMVAKWAWAAGGGYYVRRDAMGWEDFSLWCRLVELGQFGIQVADELAWYRVHAGSMVNAITEQDANKRLMVAFVEDRHPWLRLRMRDSRQRP